MKKTLKEGKQKLKNLQSILNEEPKNKKNNDYKKISMNFNNTKNRPVERNTRKRNDDDIAFFEIDEEKDDELVVCLKEVINARKSTIKELLIDSKVEYNLLYGLRVRHTIKFSSFKKWLELLKLKLEINLLPIKKI